VFTRATGKPYFQQGFYKRLRSLCARAGVPPLATHDLRRAANTLLRLAGVDPAVIRQLAGHESEEMTDLYTTRLDSHMRDAVDRLARKLA
jgi:integrase